MAGTLMEDAVNRLKGAFREAGLPPIRPARDAEALASIRRAVAPLRLPEELEQWWQLVDPASIALHPHPAPTTPSFALRTWTTALREFPGMTPRLLFPFAYESWCYSFVELDSATHRGGAVLEWSSDGAPFAVQFASLPAYLDLWTTFVEVGDFARHDDPKGEWFQFDPDGRWRDAWRVRLAAAPPRGRLGDLREIDEGVLNWPAHWQEADNYTDETRALRGATATIAQLLARAATGTAVGGTVRGAVTALMGVGSDWRASVDDGTGVLDVWCPAAVCVYGPVIHHEFEFDVRVAANPASAFDWSSEHREIQDLALGHDLEGAQAALVELYRKGLRNTPAAEATAIRPVDQRT